ncbi:DUF4253 domain-containing protein [Micromonospora fulviviridis]|uniref:DUF4253 domain-containing protein n=1 Tax=Micromonospora fulviviridis TaxID=47860 RepID=UPI001666D102|nr:DUF4253 domain-containing protein [Micromonospora fulviviridis]
MTWYEALPPDIPEGRLMKPYNGPTPVYWLSSRPAAAGDWSRWRAQHQRTGLWPLLALHVEGDDEPFGVDAEYDRITTVEQHDSGVVLGDWWQGITEEDLDEEAANDLGYLDPIGACWPGLTPDPDQQGPVESFADQYADMLTTGQARLALVPATDGAHALTAIGWTGPLNHDNDTARFAAVVRDWQRRFGATVVGLGFDTLHLSIAAPPVTVDLALRVTAEISRSVRTTSGRATPTPSQSTPRHGLELLELLVGLTRQSRQRAQNGQQSIDVTNQAPQRSPQPRRRAATMAIGPPHHAAGWQRSSGRTRRPDHVRELDSVR